MSSGRLQRDANLSASGRVQRSALAADASRRLFRVIGTTPRETCAARARRAFSGNEALSLSGRQRPELDRSRLERTAHLMNAAVLDCFVLGFESLEAGLTELPDPDDRHALAAAI